MSTGHYVKGVKETVEKMKPLSSKKSPFAAGLIGFLFGPIGIGIYFSSWKDFFVCLAFLIGLFVFIPGLGVIPGWLFSCAYGFYRAFSSNSKLGY